MNDATAVPVLVQSASRDPVESLNSLLRKGGLAVHCTWIPAVADVADALEQINPELLVVFSPGPQELVDLAATRDQVAGAVPLIVVRESIDEATVVADMARGARDTVTMASGQHVQAVVRRELRAYRLERTLSTTLRSAQDYRRQLETVLRRSNDAIAQVQEGIVVQVNTSWLELFGFADASLVVGQPVMDLFDAETHTPLRGALAACLQGRWSDHLLKAGALLADGSAVQLELVLAGGEFEGEPCVQLIVPAHQRDDKEIESELADAVCQDPATGLWVRRHMLRLCATRLESPPVGGVRCFALIQPDKFDAISREIGILAAEDFLAAFAALVRTMLGPNDIAGHFSAASLLVLLERGNVRDAEAWCEGLVERSAKHVFQVGEQSIKATCSAGLSLVPNSEAGLDSVLREAIDAGHQAAEKGGNMVVASERADHDTRVLAYDQVWVKHIRSALADNRFHLVQMPVASLTGGSQKIFDVAVRMLDLQAREVLPSEFLPAAERNDLMRPIDRWVLGASLGVIARRSPDLLFVRLSRDSVGDPTLMHWLDTQLAQGVDASRMCLQVTEEVASRHLAHMQRLLRDARQRRMHVALEHFGGGRDPLGLLAALPVDYVKIDGSLMQGLAGNEAQQQKVRTLVEAAAQRGMQTVAERIEDANTMAVVWQLGVQYIQGFLVHAPEEIVLKS